MTNGTRPTVLPGGGGTGPPSARQPLPLWTGNVVHRFIQAAYRMEHTGQPVVCERRLYAEGVGVTSRSILDLAQVPAEVPRFVPQQFLHQADLQLINIAFRTARNGYRRPDILNLRTREVFEIKPARQAAEGLRYLAASIVLFNTSAATVRRLAPPTGIEWQFLRDVADIRPGLWVPPFFVLAGTRTYIAWLGAPGLILYRPLTGRRRPESAAAVSIMDLRELQQAEADLTARTRVLGRMTTYAYKTVVLVLATLGALGSGGTAGGVATGEAATVEGTLTSTVTRQAAARTAAAETAAGGAARALERAGRFARPRWDPGSGAGALAGGDRAAAVLVPLVGDAASPPSPLPDPPASGARPIPRSEDEYVSRVALHFLANLPTSAPEQDVLERLESGEYTAAFDLPFYVKMLQMDDLARTLAALFAEFGGVSRFVQEVFPAVATSPGSPEQLADLLLQERDFQTAWLAMRALVEAPAEEVGVLNEEEYDAEIEHSR